MPSGAGEWVWKERSVFNLNENCGSATEENFANRAALQRLECFQATRKLYLEERIEIADLMAAKSLTNAATTSTYPPFFPRELLTLKTRERTKVYMCRMRECYQLTKPTNY